MLSEKKTIEASVIIAAYNNVIFLRRTLLGLVRQSFSAFEVIICDDGSGPEVGALIEEMSGRFRHGIHHVSQDDKGFRKCRILNKGVLRSSGEYLIFLDADCVPHRFFVAEHIFERENGRFLSGRRVELTERITQSLDDEKILRYGVEGRCGLLIVALIFGRVRHLEAALYVPRWMRLFPGRGRAAILGCNFSCWKKDLYEINGFDEQFESPAVGEDTDVERRFKLAGLKGKSVKHYALCYHQHHRLVSGREKSEEILLKLVKQGSVRCENGLDRYEPK